MSEVDQRSLPSDSPLLWAVWGNWGNVCGPRVLASFSASPESCPQPEEATAVVKTALSFHLKSPPSACGFQLIDFGADRGLSGFSCVYTVREMHCLVGIFPRAFYPRLFTLANALGQFWRRWMDALKVFHVAGSGNMPGKVGEALDALSDLLFQLEASRSLLVLPGLAWRGRYRDPFVRLAVSAHIACAGRSLVVGASVESVNRFLRLLHLFSPLQCAELAVLIDPDRPHRRFHPELLLQGLKWRSSPDARLPISVWEVLGGEGPLAVIDTLRKEVFRSPSLLVHQQRKRAFVAGAVAGFLEAGGELFAAQEELSVKALFSDAPVISNLVEGVLAELDSVQNTEQAAGIAGLFMRQLAAKAKALTAFMDAREAPMPRKALWAAVGVTTEHDFLLVTAVAEALRPGMFEALDRVCADHP